MQKEISIILLNTVTNTFLALSKILGGTLFNSQLLLTDGLHSASDLLTDVFSLIGLKSAKRPKDKEHPFGHGNLVYGTGLTVAMLIFFVVIELAQKLIVEWHIINNNVERIVVIIAVMTFIIKYFLSMYVLKKAKDLDSHTLMNSGIESKADALSTIVVIVGLLLTVVGIKYNITWLIYSEKIATVFVIIMLLKAAGTIYYNAIIGIAGAVAKKEIKEKYLNFIKSYDHTLEINNILVLKQGIYYNLFITLYFNVNSSIQDAYEKISNLKASLLSQDSISQVSIEFKVNNENT